MSGPIRLACTCLLAGALTGAWAEGIYVCVDAKGRRLTSDRPIPECADREQKQMNPSGTLRRVVPPTPTATERAEIDAREKKAAEEQQRSAEQKRVQKLLVARYPNQAAHDADRAKALQAIDGVIASARKRIVELAADRKKLDDESEFYKAPKPLPAQLKRQLEDNDQQVAAQQRFIAAQEDEKKRIAARYDEELARLRQVWAQNQAAAMPAAVTR
ncbi:DUF4124 domain-containing protein [Ramlibacter sp. USB13]|uniref:DUF4124 domain-containing protein n=1 Tax=Ramlibacter cellulosilyticus TaxID=2764187 RepID=A0A923SBP9_9BURK|nr:DUF4124 domain-containing protein [Ramlibacter cellulosilyticus]MBC5784121.1 DUF4124 domain-containing protein [Ramlibacter cellulosilyticus]